jgi:hypothetical protein
MRVDVQKIHLVAVPAQDMTSCRAKRKQGVDENERRKNRTKAKVRSKVERLVRLIERAF